MGEKKMNDNRANNIWKTETRKGGAEIYVECENRSIFVGEGYSPLEYGESMALASVIEKALNEFEEEYEGHDKGSNQHLIQSKKT
tara:strand:- start:349 stop:603 length:255 start_codon:yes stop_codon:yes gene_type:complete